MNVRNWTRWMVQWFIILFIILVPLAFWLSQLTANSKLRRATFSVIMAQPSFWLMTILAVVFLYGPLYVFKRWQQVVKYPKFYSV